MHTEYTPLTAITVAKTALAAGNRRRNEILAAAAAGSVAEFDLKDFHMVGTKAIEFRQISDGNADDSNIVNVYGCHGSKDDYYLIGTTTGSQGTQTYKGKTTEFFADVLTVTSVDNGHNMSEFSTADNNIAKVRMLVGGCSHLLFIATTKATTTLKIHVAPVDVNMVLGDVTSLLLPSDGGGIEIVTMGGTSAGNGADQACRSALIWSADADTNFKIGATAADANDALLPAGVPIPIPVSNTNLLRFYSTGGGTANIVWRN